MDVNKDRLITMEEFLTATEKKEFLEPDSWETLDQQQLFTEEELKEYERHIAEQEAELKQRESDLHQQREELQKQQEELQAQKTELKQVVEQMEMKKTQQVLPPGGPNGELQFHPPGEQSVVNAELHHQEDNPALKPVQELQKDLPKGAEQSQLHS